MFEAHEFSHISIRLEEDANQYKAQMYFAFSIRPGGPEKDKVRSTTQYTAPGKEVSAEQQ